MITTKDIFQLQNDLSDAEMEFIKMVYVKGKSKYKMPNGETKDIKI